MHTEKKDDCCDVLVLGAGASGLLCAATAARRGLRVTLLEQAPKAGRKIAISGGGKCNFTNRTVSVQDYVSAQPEFCAPALLTFRPEDMLHWFKTHRLTWEERDHGRLFGLQSAESVVDELVRDCFQAGVTMHTLCRVDTVQPPTEEQPLFRAHCTRLKEHGTEAGQARFHAHQLVLALGSAAWAASGATDKGLTLAKAMGHSICPVRPVLTPLHMPDNWALRGLSGISIEVEITAGGHTFKDALLFTHQGISGPATLLASCHWQTGAPLTVNFLPEQSFAALLDAPECGKLLVKNLLGRHLPQRLVQGLLPQTLADRKVAELSRKHRSQLAQSVHCHEVIPTGTGGLRKAEAAAGGVNVAEIHPHTLESRIVPRLFATGEVLDVAGHLGGYNLHWAFASGILAGNSVKNTPQS